MNTLGTKLSFIAMFALGYITMEHPVCYQVLINVWCKTEDLKEMSIENLNILPTDDLWLTEALWVSHKDVKGWIWGRWNQIQV